MATPISRLAPVAAALALVACGGSPPAGPLGSLALPFTLYPTSHYATQEGLGLAVAHACVDVSALAQPERLQALVPSLLAAARLRAAHPGEPCQLTLAFEPATPSELDGAALAAWDATAGDRHVVVVRLEGGRAVAHLWSDGDERAAIWALVAALGLVENGVVRAGVIVDGPAIALRGLIEGHYGPLLSPLERACLFDGMLRLRQNVYVYGPKDDPYAHVRWADPYPDADAAAIAGAAAAARAHAIDFVWAVSPGLPDGAPAPGASISFASAADFARLTAKIDAMRALGVSRFALFLDDIGHNLVWDADLATFATRAAAHASLANRLDAFVTAAGAPHLLFVGQDYTSAFAGWQGYVQDLGARLAPGIGVMWTGPRVYSATIAAADLREVDAALGREVIIWDNEPESAGAIAGRAADLPSAISGYLTNTAILQAGGGFAGLWQLLGPVADYAWNPTAYDAASSWSTWSARAGGCVSAPSP